MAVPLFQHIIDDVRESIRVGRLRPGDRLHSVTTLCAQYNVSAITVKRALQELQALKLVKGIKGKGTFVLPSADHMSTTDDFGALPQLKRIQLFTTNPDPFQAKGFWGDILDGIRQACGAAGIDYNIQIIPLAAGLQTSLVVDLQPDDAAIFLATKAQHNLMPLLQNNTVRKVWIDGVYPGLPSVLTDNADGMAKMLKHLHDHGHRRALLVAFNDLAVNAINENERITAFSMLAPTLGIETEIVRWTTPETILERLAEPNPPTAVLFTQDGPATRFIRLATENGICVPDAVSVSGFDGFVRESDISDALTTVRVDRHTLGSSAVDYLRGLLSNDGQSGNWLRVPGQLVTGQTVGPCPKVSR